jgi:hypothetical protein
VTFPPGSVFADASFDAEAAQEEAVVRLRGLANHFEKEDPGMHKTNTVDGTRHAWRNKGTKPVTMLFFLNGARARETSQA